MQTSLVYSSGSASANSGLGVAHSANSLGRIDQPNEVVEGLLFVCAQ